MDLCLSGGISIRKYSISSKETNFEQLCRRETEKPIIPGTSWAGAIRSRAQEILEELFLEDPRGKEKANNYIRKWFGWVETKNTARKNQKYAAEQSIVSISESEIEDSKPLLMTRNKINRFDASTVEGALYTEKTYVKGRTKLEIKVRKGKDEERKALCGLLLLVVKDIQCGYLALGGQTAVGRGIFEGSKGAVVEEEQTYMKALYNLVKGGAE